MNPTPNAARHIIATQLRHIVGRGATLDAATRDGYDRRQRRGWPTYVPAVQRASVSSLRPRFALILTPTATSTDGTMAGLRILFFAFVACVSLVATATACKYRRQSRHFVKYCGRSISEK